MKSFSRDELLAIGVSELAPPPFSWRQLRVVYELKANSSRHLWAVIEKEKSVVGYEMPAAEFERLCEEGLALRLPKSLRIPQGRVLVRTEQGTFEARPASEIAPARRKFLLDGVERALRFFNEKDDVEAAQGWLDRARLAEDKPQIATVLRAGLARQLNEKTEWAQLAMEEFKEEAPFIEFDIIQPSLFWERLPYPELREKWLSFAETIARENFKLPTLGELLPTPERDRNWAVWILLARRARTHPVLTMMSHREIVAIGSCNASTLDQWRAQLKGFLSGTTEAQRLEHLKALTAAALPDSELERLRNETELRTRTGDLRHHAIMVARLEATLGDGARQVAWRKSAAHLNRIAFQPGLQPWRQGEEAANQLREYWSLGTDTVKELVSFARREVGLAAFASNFPGKEFDSCHVIDRAVPPASYLDEDVATSPPRTRFALAQAIGLQALDPFRAGVRFYHSTKLGQPARTSGEGEMAANAFAAYFLAPRSSVQGAIRKQDLATPEGYRSAIQKVMERFGMSFSAAFAHVANCHGEDPRYEWFAQIQERLETVESDFTQDRLEIPEIPSGTKIPLERANGFASLLVRAIATGAVSTEEAPRLLGDESEAVRDWLHDKVAQLQSLQMNS